MKKKVPKFSCRLAINLHGISRVETVLPYSLSLSLVKSVVNNLFIAFGVFVLLIPRLRLFGAFESAGKEIKVGFSAEHASRSDQLLACGK
jgi:hypothetical protein